MHKIEVLIVEDEDSQLAMYDDAIDDFNENKEYNIESKQVKTAREAIDLLAVNHYDAVFVDLNLADDDAIGNSSGNDVVKYLLGQPSARFLIYIISGTLNSLDDDYKDKFKTPILRTFDRLVCTADVLTDLLATYKTGVTKILGKRGKIEGLIDKIFYEHLAPGFDVWVKKNADCETELLRYLALHLQEYLDLPQEQNAGDSEECRYFEPELYVYPPIRTPLATGDIVQCNASADIYVVLSPACDLAVRKEVEGQPEFNVETVVLAKVIPVNVEVAAEYKIPFQKYNKSQSQSWRSFVNSLKTYKKQRFYYLPQYRELGESFIDYKRLQHVDIYELLNQFNRLATVSNIFMREIQGTFAAYYGRQGQPEVIWKS